MKLTIQSKIKCIETGKKAPLGLLGACAVFFLFSFSSYAQENAQASARIDAKQIVVGDQARLFIEVNTHQSGGRLQWAAIPDSFNNLEVVEKGKIDTIGQGDVVTYKQRLLITGFDSGVFKIPPFVFSVISASGTAYTIQTDSFSLLVQTVAVDTTKGFMGIKGIINVKSTWLDYLLYIAGGIIFVVLLVYMIIYFLRNKKATPKQQGPQETLQEYALRMLSELDARQLWQKQHVKEYYVELTDVVRNYIEARFNTPAMELTTDELLAKAETNRELQKYIELLSDILYTADLAKFAKAQPLPQEHMDAMEKAKQFVRTSKPYTPTATHETEPKP